MMYLEAKKKINNKLLLLRTRDIAHELNCASCRHYSLLYDCCRLTGEVLELDYRCTFHWSSCGIIRELRKEDKRELLELRLNDELKKTNKKNEQLKLF